MKVDDTDKTKDLTNGPNENKKFKLKFKDNGF